MTKFYYIPNSVTYYMYFHLSRTIKIQYRYRNDAIVYAIRCQVTNMVYVGSTFSPGRRLYQHLVSGLDSNQALQRDIHKYGIDRFTFYVLEVVDFPQGACYDKKGQHLRRTEQMYMDKYPKSSTIRFGVCFLNIYTYI